MDQRHSPDDPPETKAVPPPESPDELRLEPPPAPPLPQRDTHSEPRYSLPPLPPLNQDTQPASTEDVAQVAPPTPAGQGHRRVDKILTPRHSAASPPLPSPPSQPAYTYPATSATYGGEQAYTQAPTPIPKSAPITEPIQPQQSPPDQPGQAINGMSGYGQPPPYSEYAQGGYQQADYSQAQPYPPQQPGYAPQSYYPTRRGMRAWAWGLIGSVAVFTVVLVGLLVLLRPPGIVGKWKPDTSQPTAEVAGGFGLDNLAHVMNNLKCGYSDSLEFSQDGAASTTTMFGANAGRYEVTEGSRLKFTSPAGSSLWTFNVSGDTLTLQGPEGCAPARYARVK